MQEILHAFGIDWRLIVIQIFNFGILVAALWYFLYTPVLKLLAEREEKIKQGLADAEAAATSRHTADTEKAEVLKGAHSEAQQVVARANAHADERAKALHAEAQEKIARDIAQAKMTADEIKLRAVKESEAEIAKLAFLGAEKVLRKELSK
jgi:F-type H+-transporting ATPase subunit b